MSQLNFDARQVAPAAPLDPIPAGWYKVIMDESEMKPTKSGDGAYLNCRFSVVEGQFQGRKVFSRLNLRNANAVAQEIAFKQLSAIAHAVNVLQVADSAQLHNIPLMVKVKLRKDDTGEYEDNNEISSYKAVDNTAPPGAGAPASFGSVPPPAAPPAAGWNAPPPPAQVVHNPLAVAVADGWIKHPTAPGYHYKGQEVLTDAQVAAKYPAPVAAPPSVPTVQAPAAPGPWTPPNGGQPWAHTPPAVPGAAAAPAAPPGPPHPAQSNVPPWQQPKA